MKPIPTISRRRALKTALAAPAIPLMAILPRSPSLAVAAAMAPLDVATPAPGPRATTR